MRFIVAQLGARMHYAVPAILARADMLERLYTDTYAAARLRSLFGGPSHRMPAPLRRWLGRIPLDIPEERIVSFAGLGLEYYWRRVRSAASGSSSGAYLWGGGELCRRVLRRGLGNGEGVYTFNSAGLELLEAARTRGLAAVMEQTIAPGAVEDELLDFERRSFPEWEPAGVRDPFRGALNERERREWAASDLILCGSEFVREGIEACGGPVDRCRVVPYGIRLPTELPAKDFSHRPLRILTVGMVGLRKGAPYVLEAARRLKGAAQFRMVGHLAIPRHVQELLGAHLDLVDAVPRAEMRRHFLWADVFLLPSICEGSATATYEALGYGLPTIATANAGSVVRHGIDGFVVPIRDSDAIVEKLQCLDADRDLLATMSRSARQRAEDFTLERYGERLLSELYAFH
jgi:glycosyltransferase involved in cell wall biosynthesis